MYIQPSKRRSRRGFTLAEMMAVVAILAILAALAIPNLVSYQRLLRMQELDHCAQELFLSAQNRLTARKSSGTVAQLAGSGAEGERLVQGIPELSGARFLTEQTVDELMPRETLESGLLNGSFYILYDQDSGSVLAVLYSREPFAYQEGYGAVGLSARERVARELWVGWYNGAPAGSESVVQLDAPSITIHNGEKLTAEITVTTPSATAAPLSSIDLKVSIGDVSLPAGDPVPVGAMSQRYTIVLDSLAAGEPRFAELGTGVAPGEDFTLRAWAGCTSSSVQDSPYNYASGNSLFASGSGGGTAYIACGRHLQNLDQSSGVEGRVNQAVQTANLRFDDTGAEDCWYAYYTRQGVSFQPITNHALAVYNGYDASKQAQTTITGLSASGTQAGMFAAFSGAGLYNVWLVNPSFHGGQYAGGLAALADGDHLAIENCRVYHAYADRSVREALTSFDNHQVSAPQSGGLVGRALGAITVTDSLAATLVHGERLAGGLVGSAGSVTVSGSYAACYLSGYQVGGLAGQVETDGRVASCYTAGFVSNADIAAGLACGPAHIRVEDSYSAVSYLSAEDTDVYPLVTDGSAASSYYLAVPASADNGIGVSCSGNQLEQLTLSGQFAPATGSTTRPYNLMEGMALTIYSFPRLARLPHYGDWRSEFESGALVYYERYEDGSYGFYGASLGRLQEDKEILSDGYAVAFRQDSPAGSVSVRYGGTTYPLSLSNLPTVTDPGAEGGPVTYCLAPLPDLVVNSTAAAPDFYQTVTVTVDGAGAEYYFNPHFAKTAVARAEGETGLPEAPSPISIRTPRHLYALSCFSSAYPGREGWAYTQERALNYAKYRWSAVGFTSAMAGTAHVQAPIGPSQEAPFAGTYNGGGRTISGVSVSGPGQYLGLFGVNTGTIRGVIYDSDGSYVRPAAGITGRSATVYVGGLAGRNSGAIRDSAVAGVELSARNTGNSTVYMGGLAGDNQALIRQCTAACGAIRITSTRANAFAAAFAGRSSGTITRCYSQGAVNVAKDTSGTVAAAGFVCENTGSVSASYCAAGLYADGGAREAAFCWSGERPVSGCYYLTDGSYTFAGQTFALTYADRSGAVGLKQAALAQQSIPGMTLADDSTRADGGILDADVYPYPLVLDRHYGPWLQRLDLGELGVCYWEKEEKPSGDGGVSQAYHFSFVGLRDLSAGTPTVLSNSTLCGYHDDGGVITDYGYAYYYRRGAGRTVSLHNDSTVQGVSASSLNSAAQAALEAQMEGQYDFTAYGSYDPSTQKGLYPKNESVNAVWSLSCGGKQYPFTISPFFAASIKYNNDSASAYPGKAESSPYGVRSIQQLQFINWNHAEKNCTTNSQDKAGKYPYLGYDDHVTDDKISTRTRGYYYLQGHDLNGKEVEQYTPIGSMTNWFAGHYNGNDYVIRELSIHSSARLVGLFGLIHGGTINNVVLHSEQGAAVESTYGSGNYSGLGVLAGAALNDKSTVNNCAVSGYRVIRRGAITDYTSVGGLFGMCNIPLNGCTAVTDIEVSTSAGSKAVRVGGLVGSAKCTIAQCYTGGSLRYTGGNANNLYLGGVTGYEDSPSTDNGGPGTPLKLQNCYTYCQVPSQGKRYAVGPGTISNCYYLGEAVPGSVMDRAALPRTYEQFTDGTLLRELNGSLSGAARRFSPVTTAYADGTAIDGRYTFPARGDLDGRNYPFPAILTQEADQVEGGTARLHYGDWPEKGLLGQTLVEVDLIARREDGSADSSASVQLAPTEDLAGGGSYALSNAADPRTAQASLDAASGLLTVTGVSPGYTAVTAVYTVDGQGYTLDIEIAVTAAVDVTVTPASATLIAGGSQIFTAAAADKYGNRLSGEALSWLPPHSNAPSVADVAVPGDPEAEEYVFTALGLSRSGDTQDAVFTAAAAYTDPDTGAVYSGQGRASVTVVPVSITAESAALALGGGPVSYGPDRLTVQVQDLTLAPSSITAVRVADPGVVQASLDPETGLVILTPAALGRTQAVLTLSYVYNGETYHATAAAEVAVLEHLLTLTPSNAAPQLVLGQDVQTVGLSLNAPDAESFVLTLDEAYDHTVVSARLEGGVLLLQPLAAGETTLTVTASHPDDPSLTVAASLQVTVSAPPALALSVPDTKLYVPLGGQVTIPLQTVSASLPQGVSQVEITGVDTFPSKYAQAAWDAAGLTLSGSSAGMENLKLNVRYRYLYTPAADGPGYPCTGNALVYLETEVLNQAESTSFVSSGSRQYSASASLTVLADSGGQVVVSNRVPNTDGSDWTVSGAGADVSGVRPDVSGQGSNRQLTVTFDRPSTGGVVTVTATTGNFWKTTYTLTIDLTVCTNPAALSLTFQAPEG